jgi:hypothetical protein
MRVSSSLLLPSALIALSALALAGCPPDPPIDGGTDAFADGGTLVPPSPTDGGFTDAGDAIPVDAGPVNTAVVVESVSRARAPSTAATAC